MNVNAVLSLQIEFAAKAPCQCQPWAAVTQLIVTHHAASSQPVLESPPAPTILKHSSVYRGH